LWCFPAFRSRGEHRLSVIEAKDEMEFLRSALRLASHECGLASWERPGKLAGKLGARCKPIQRSDPKQERSYAQLYLGMCPEP
jgi:hypothetical protein